MYPNTTTLKQRKKDVVGRTIARSQDAHIIWACKPDCLPTIYTALKFYGLLIDKLKTQTKICI